MLLRHRTFILVFSLIFAGSACQYRAPAADPTSVARGLRFVSHNATFDSYFADLHDEQLAMLQLPEQERQLRKDLAIELKVADGATITVLGERAASIAQALFAQGTTLKLEVEGFNAVDEADTAAQMRVSGTLDGDNLKFAESITRAARSELKVLARLNAKEQSLQRLAARAAVLEAEVDRAFAGDSNLIDTVHRNLSDAKLLIALMGEHRLDLAVDARRTVERLASVVTTNPSLSASNEPPLVTFVKPEPPRDRSLNRIKPGGGPATPVRGGASKSAPEANAPAADFEP